MVRYTDSGFSTTEREAAAAAKGKPAPPAEIAENLARAGCCSFVVTGAVFRLFRRRHLARLLC